MLYIHSFYIFALNVKNRHNPKLCLKEITLAAFIFHQLYDIYFKFITTNGESFNVLTEQLDA